MANDMTRDQLKKKIKTKFGTYSNFCDLAKPRIDRYDFQKYFLTNVNVSKNEIDRIKKLVERTVNDPEHIFDQNVVKIKNALREYGGAYKFSQENPDFSENTVYQIISENSSYKRMTPMVKKLMKALGI